MNYEKRYNELIDAIKEMLEANPHDEGIQNWVQDNVPELAESEDERIRGAIIDHLKDNNLTEWASWLEKQVPVDEEKMLIGARRDVASSIESLENLLSFLDSLEVKELDLDKEARKYLLNEHKSPLSAVFHQTDLRVEMQYHKDIENAFKAGYELRLKVQKGE